MTVYETVKLLGYKRFPRAYARLYWRKQQGKGSRVAEVFDAYVKPGGQVIDVGASLGLFSLRFLEMVGSGGRVHAIEPQMRYENGHVRLGDLFPNFSHQTIAVSDSEGEAHIQVPAYDGTPDYGRASLSPDLHAETAEGATVRTASLDSVVHDFDLRPTFIKIDVEGFEFEVLSGGLETLTRFRPAMVIEILQHFRPDRFSATFELLDQNGYEVYAMSRRGLLPFDQFDVSRHQTPYIGSLDSADDEGFIYDFLAVPSELDPPPSHLFA